MDEDYSMVVTILATAVVRSESLAAVRESLNHMKEEPDQKQYVKEIESALSQLDIIANDYTFRLKEPPEDQGESNE